MGKLWENDGNLWPPIGCPGFTSYIQQISNSVFPTFKSLSMLRQCITRLLERDFIRIVLERYCIF